MKKIFSIPYSLESTCIHEAAHAVIFYHFDIRVKYISITGEGDGFVNAPQTIPTALFTKDFFSKKDNENFLFMQLEKYAIIKLAGYAAEFKHNKKRLPFNLRFTTGKGEANPENDYTKAYDQMDLANELTGSNIYGDFTFYLWEVSTRRLIRRKHIWAAIEELAKVLMNMYRSGKQIMDGKEVRVILQKHFKKTMVKPERLDVELYHE